MSNKYQEISDAILNGIGGRDNVSSCTHCVTRLRFIIKDRSLVDEAALKSIRGVLGTQWSGDQLQVIVGQIVDEIYDLICAQAGFEVHEAIDENLDGDLGTRHTAKDIPKMALDALSGCIFPIIPIIIPAGIIQLIASILGPNLLNVLPADSDLITLFTFVGNTGFYFIPIFAAWSASKYFKTSTPVAIFLGAVLIHPTLLQLVTDGTPFTVYGIPMQLVTYSSQFLPSILSVWIMSYVYKFIKKHMPESLRYAFLPLCTILIMLPIELCAIGPLGSGIGVVIGAIATWLANVAGPVAIGLIGGLWYFLVALGMDKALSPVIMNQFATYGYDGLFWCSAVFGTYSLLGVAVAEIFHKRSGAESAAVSNAITLGLGGVSEPTIFTSILPNKANMAALFVGGFVGGIIGGLFGCKAYTFGTGNALFCTVFAGGDGTGFIPGVVACVIAFLLSFAISFISNKVLDGRKAKEDSQTADSLQRN